MLILSPDTGIKEAFDPSDLSLLEKIEGEEKVLYEVESVFHRIFVVENRLGQFIKFDDSYQSGIINHPLYKGNIPYVNYFLLTTLMNSSIKKVLILGMGTGNLANNLIQLVPDLQKIDIVEIDPDVVEIAKEYFDFKPDSRVNINIQDARVFVRNSKTKYDLVILDIFTGSGMPYRLATEEFLREVSGLLSVDGILTSNLFSSTEIEAKNNAVFKSFLKTYKSVFANTLIFPTVYGNIELYKDLMGLSQLPHITNVVAISSNSGLLSSDMLVNKAEEFKNKFNDIEIVKYAQDLYDKDIDLSESETLKDASEGYIDFDSDNISYYQ